ncbi:helix-hairpin-helix domain-containing protein [Streptomyces sp. NPDC059897]|uniref:helix-hairpin-helix domain-containing protein n=1 Tax=Streptomyces sp. NPDC059897 TaxID=3346994 RepID=UPI0036483E6C
MELRSRTRATYASSGPGRGRTSDGRTSDSRARQRHVARRRARRRRVEAERTRVRAEALFAPPPSAGVPGRVVSAAASESASVSPEAVVPPERAASVPSSRQRAVLAVRDRLPLWVQTRCGVERRGAVALAVLVAVVGLFAVQHFWAGRTQQVRAPETVRAAAPRAVEPPGGGVSPGASGPGPVATGAAGVVVDVGGKVRRPGVRRLPAGSRVADALRAAGGVRPGADTAGLNRARLLVDGEQVLVGEPATAAAAPAGGSAGASEPAGPVGLNTATLEQLDTLPGVGPVLAQHIVDYRTEHGGFRSVDELREVNGIGDRRFEDLQNLVRP